MKEMNIPVGVSDFEEIRKNEYYYIDKSELIGELLSRTGIKVTLITRPRRFGKTLGMSMLESFFDIRKESRKLFEGLKITENQALCDAWMNQYPTIFVFVSTGRWTGFHWGIRYAHNGDCRFVQQTSLFA